MLATTALYCGGSLLGLPWLALGRRLHLSARPQASARFLTLDQYEQLLLDKGLIDDVETDGGVWDETDSIESPMFGTQRDLIEGGMDLVDSPKFRKKKDIVGRGTSHADSAVVRHKNDVVEDGSDQVDASLFRRKKGVVEYRKEHAPAKFSVDTPDPPVVDVYCNFDSDESGLCVAKKQDGDFTDIFMYNSTREWRQAPARNVVTRSCDVVTYPPIFQFNAKKNPHSTSAFNKLRENLRSVAKKIRFNEPDGSAVETHLLVMACDIAQPAIDFVTSVLYLNPRGDRPESFDLMFTSTKGDRQMFYTFDRVKPEDFTFYRPTPYKSDSPKYTASLTTSTDNFRKRALHSFMDGDKRVDFRSRLTTTLDSGRSYSFYTLGPKEGTRGEAFTFALPSFSRSRIIERKYLKGMMVYYRNKWTVLRSY
ncbi:hypothetical protein FOZ63_018669 [Perkinsus olseni]|uniref:Uncharacterized protein n=1 Tax=Perkinsus olseni TaxID=32597 RepID=A0A7J6SD61_PEROL|nr:hypothetical protein FOZ63_018669 [Perkinsus olseni]